MPPLTPHLSLPTRYYNHDSRFPPSSHCRHSAPHLSLPTSCYNRELCRIADAFGGRAVNFASLGDRNFTWVPLATSVPSARRIVQSIVAVMLVTYTTCVHITHECTLLIHHLRAHYITQPLSQTASHTHSAEHRCFRPHIPHKSPRTSPPPLRHAPHHPACHLITSHYCVTSDGTSSPLMSPRHLARHHTVSLHYLTRYHVTSHVTSSPRT